MVDRVGQQLGNYILMRQLGEGGFAEVYLGEHIHLGTKAAIKVLHTQLSSETVDNFRSEARTIARLVHPHIVRVLEFGIEGKTPFLVMDYASHGTLRQRHSKGSMLPLSTVVSYVEQVADALQYGHDEKLIHRDVKPENMLLGARGDVLLSDFGIALVAQSSRYQSTQEMAGTMAYMSPEQIQGKPRTASDQYSLGIVVYEWITGTRPFHGSAIEIVTQHLAVAPTPLRAIVPTIADDVEQVVLTALAKDAKARFGSIQAFATALKQACQTASPRPVQRHPQELPLHKPSQSTDEERATPPNQPPLLEPVIPPPSQPTKPYGTATPSGQGMTLLARLGYAIKGVLYLVIGFLAVQLAFGAGGKATDQRGALQTISGLPFGKFLLIVMTIGLFGFALWCFIQALFDTEGKGRDAKGIIARVGYAAVGISYAALGFGTYQLVAGTGNSGKNSTTSAQDWTAELLKQPFGTALVVIVGLIVLAVAFYLFSKAYTAKFQSRLNLLGSSAQMKKWIVGLGRFGYSALGVVFTIIGFFMIMAAFQHNASKTVGLDGALKELALQPFGPLLLAIVALGLIAYGVYSFAEAHYRRIGR